MITNNNFRILYFGKGIRGETCLRYLIEKRQNIVGIVAPKDGFDLKSIAKEAKIKCLQPENINDHESQKILEELQADLFVLSGYNKIIKSNIINIPKYGAINLHGGKLPDYRGVAPINWQIINGEKEGGCCIIFVDERIDTGDIIIQKYFKINKNDTAQIILNKTLKIFPKILLETINNIKNGTVKRRKQNQNMGSYYTRRHPRDGQIFWYYMKAKEAHNLIRGLSSPYPNAFTFFKGKKLFIKKSQLIDMDIKGVPGKIIRFIGDSAIVICADKGLQVDLIQFENSNDIVLPKGNLQLYDYFESKQ